MRRNPRSLDETRRMVRAGYLRGDTLRQIAAGLGVSPSQVAGIAHRMGLVHPGSLDDAVTLNVTLHRSEIARIRTLYPHARPEETIIGMVREVIRDDMAAHGEGGAG